MTLDDTLISKLALEPGDVLVAKITSDSISELDVNELKIGLQAIFTENKIVVLALPANSDVKFDVIKQEIK